ncbi:multifunctional CCA tRNA nucleotidyl transferase/2'3'-cyclic phosphodiesterase/2'nucleotidase/phosphatase [bacterium]|nr:multifunctional CCA tRNA nucleotidyl transferase/2'3'-cyclic phosphodiesterase/2'nucleotidase/phosphatase [bacterium]
MKIYRVGGSVRDEILGIPVHDTDFVVVGATVDDFMQRFPNALKVGKSFPVFLVDGSEYAFARKERKSGVGHCAFDIVADPGVTLEEDLKRRDLTINAIAKDLETGELIDPFGGVADIGKRLLRHVSPAFAEDPLRVYRVARFAAKFPDFSVDGSTVALMNSMAPELSSLSSERVWGECEKALGSQGASRFFRVLKEAGLLSYHFREVEDLIGVPAGPVRYHPEGDTFNHTMDALDRLNASGCRNPIVAFAVLCHDWGKASTDPSLYPKHHGHDIAGIPLIEAFFKRMKGMPAEYRKAAAITAEFHMNVRYLREMHPKKAIRFILNISAFPGGIDGFFDSAKADFEGEIEEERRYAKMFKPVFELSLPQEFRNLGKESGEKLMELRVRKFCEIREAVREPQNS